MPEPVATLTIAITTRALFHLEDSHALFEREGIAAFAEHQRRHEDDVLEPGIAFPLVRKLLALNAGAPAGAPRVEVILLSRNSSDTGLRVFNSIQQHGLDIRRATFTAGAPVWPYIKPFGAQLFLSANPDSVRNALEAGVAAATILPARAGVSRHDQLRIAFDGDAVIFGDESERISREHGVEALVSGAVHTTANTVRPALQLIKTAPGSSIVSSVFFMLMPDQVLVYGDCAINPDPNAAELAEIALQSAASAEAFGIEPRVAMISYSTGSSGVGADVDKVRAATVLAKEKDPDLLIDGPLQYDAASVMEVGKQKAPNSPVAGRATVFVFPDLNTGNTTYKAVQRSAHLVSIGPMLQGLRKPVNDLSRGALVDDIVFTIALTAIQAYAQ